MRFFTAVFAVGVLLFGGALLDSLALPAARSRPALAAPTDGAPVDGGPNEGAPIDAAPVDGAPSDGAPITRAPSDSASVDGAPTDGAPTDSAFPTVAGFKPYWVAAHAETTLWSDPTARAEALDEVHQWTAFYVVQPAHDGRLYVWDPAVRDYAWIDAQAVGPVDPSLAGTGFLPPIGKRVAWTGAARVTMYSCVELGGCAHTASGLWPQEGMVAVDPTVIPLGSTIWIQGLGTFLAADTGSLVRGSHIDIYSTSYVDAVQWGVQRLPIVVFEPS